MKRALVTLFMIALVVFPLASRMAAQDKPDKDVSKSAEGHKRLTPVKVQIVFTEYDGDKKVKILPYSLLADADNTWSKVRIGTRVPVYTGGPNGGMQYIDVGTNIDCRVTTTDDGKYQLELRLERSWVEGDVFVPVERHSASPNEDPTAGKFAEPIIRQISSVLNLALRDGQSVEGNVMSDPISGRVTKVDVSLTLAK